MESKGQNHDHLSPSCHPATSLPHGSYTWITFTLHSSGQANNFSYLLLFFSFFLTFNQQITKSYQIRPKLACCDMLFHLSFHGLRVGFHNSLYDIFKELSNCSLPQISGPSNLFSRPVTRASSSYDIVLSDDSYKYSLLPVAEHNLFPHLVLLEKGWFSSKSLIRNQMCAPFVLSKALPSHWPCLWLQYHKALPLITSKPPSPTYHPWTPRALKFHALCPSIPLKLFFCPYVLFFSLASWIHPWKFISYVPVYRSIVSNGKENRNNPNTHWAALLGRLQYVIPF